MTNTEILQFIAEYRDQRWADAIAARLLLEDEEDITQQQIDASSIDTLLRTLAQMMEIDFDCSIDINNINKRARHAAKYT